MDVQVYSRRLPNHDFTQYGTLVSTTEVGENWFVRCIAVETTVAFQQLLHDFGRMQVEVQHGSFHESDIYQDVVNFEHQSVLCIENVVGGGVRYAVYDETLRDVGQVQLPVPVAVRAARALIRWAEGIGKA